MGAQALRDWCPDDTTMWRSDELSGNESIPAVGPRIPSEGVSEGRRLGGFILLRIIQCGSPKETDCGRVFYLWLFDGGVRMRVGLRGLVRSQFAHHSRGARTPSASAFQSSDGRSGVTARDPVLTMGSSHMPAADGSGSETSKADSRQSRSITALPVAQARPGPIGARVRPWRSDDAAASGQGGTDEVGAPDA